MLVNMEDLERFNRPLPRYTSYPTANVWGELDAALYATELTQLGDEPLSLYLHIPFCHSMCLYCGCSVILNRLPDNEEVYVRYLLREIEMVSKLSGKKRVSQIHFGGGTPTKITTEQLQRIIDKLSACFSIEPDAEIAIEIDPRTVVEDNGAKLKALKKMGFNRVSFGVQDTDEKVQEAVRRRQSAEMSKQTMLWAKELEFSGINIDLIYGLPLQTPKTFEKTQEDILEMGPDRIALFSYAKVPWLKAHQKAIKDKDLPSTKEKFQIYLQAREAFIHGGYFALGMDHFAKETDPLKQALDTGKLYRNFQGFSVKKAGQMLSFGITAIGQTDNGFFQNAKELKEYYEALDQGRLPTKRGKLLSKDDQIRQWVIQSLMCTFTLDKQEFFTHFNEEFDRYFTNELSQIQPFIDEGIMTHSKDNLSIQGKGCLFSRNLVAPFDHYLQKEQIKNRFSKSI